MRNPSNQKRKRVAVFASGNGSNFQAIYDHSRQNDINGDIIFVLTNNPSAYVLERAKKAGVKSICIDSKKNIPRIEFNKEVLKVTKNENIDLVCLAGYMMLLDFDFLDEFQNKIINVHPSLLPSFKGMNGIKDAFDYGVKVTGVTVHFVDYELDHGPIILQESIEIPEGEKIEELEAKIHKVEHKIYPLAVQYFCNDQLKIVGRKVRILERS